MSTADRIRGVVEPLVTGLDLNLYDLEVGGGIVRVTVDRPGGASLDEVAAATRAVSRALDEHDPIDGRYTLEVSTPGLERNLRTPAHYQGALGAMVSVKTRYEVDGERRFRGTIIAADDDGFAIRADEPHAAERRFGYGDIDKARTVFEWGPGPKPGAPRTRTTTTKKRATT
jgi:ribosome maturation factor RimP